MDTLDHRILDLLEQRGFQRAGVLAAELGASVQTVRRRINRLRSGDVIKIIAIRDPLLFGYKGWAEIGLKVQLGYTDDVLRRLVENPRVYFVNKCFGEFDIWISVLFETIEGLTMFVDSELTRAPGIIGTETMLLSCPRKYYHFLWPISASNKTNDVTGCSSADIRRSQYLPDEIDSKIISILTQDGLIRPAALKERLGLSESTIRKHVKNLLNHRLVSLEVIVNPEIVQYEVWATVALKTDGRYTHEVVDKVIENPAVHFASLSLGRFNIMLSARFHNVDLLAKFTSVDLPAIRGVTSVQSFIHSKPVKYYSIDLSHWNRRT